MLHPIRVGYHSHECVFTSNTCIEQNNAVKSENISPEKNLKFLYGINFRE